MPRKPKFDAHELGLAIIAKLDAIKGDSQEDLATVPAMFKALPCSPLERYDVFQMLDERPGLFPGYSYPGSTGWHSKLRRVRNDSRLDLFAAFRE